MRELIKTDSLWAKIRKKEHITDILYGLRDNTNNHGHTVISGADLLNPIYQRDVSGAILLVSGANLILNNRIVLI